MISYITFFVASFTSLFTIVNPFSTASVFITISKGDSKIKKRKMAKKAAVTAALILIVFSVLGNYILSFFSITIDAFRIAGGILIISVGMRMVKAKREYFSNEKEEKHAKDKEDVSLIPLAIPMMSGPGAMTTALVLMSSAESIPNMASVIIAIILVCLLSFFILTKAEILEKILGVSGQKVFERILGLIVLVIGVQFIINGVLGVVTQII